MTRLRWVHNQFRYFQIDWDAIRVIRSSSHGIVLLRQWGDDNVKPIASDEPDALKHVVEAMAERGDREPTVISLNGVGLPGDEEQVERLLAFVRSDLQWIELVELERDAAGQTVHSPLFVRVLDIESMRDEQARRVWGPKGHIDVPEGLSITLKDGTQFDARVRAIGPAADRLRKLVDDWHAHPPYSGLVDPVT